MNTFSWYEWPEPLKYRHLAALEDIYQSKKEFVKSLDPFASFGSCFFTFLKACICFADRYIHCSAIPVPKAMAESS